MNKDDTISECFTSCIVKSKYFSKETGMDDSSSDFQEKKTYNKGPKNVQKSKVSKPKKPLKKRKGQRDIRTLIKNKNSELVTYSKNFDQVCKKSGVDVDSEQLQLAIALSKSLHDSETKSDDKLQESKILTSQERTAKIRTTLQEYGFRVPSTKISKDLNKRRKFKKQYKLLLVSNEEKQQNISDRYAEVLSKNIHKSPLKSNNKSNDYNNQEIFYKATHINYECMKNDNVFYIKKLIEKPLIKSCSLRDWSTIPGRPASPKREVRNFNFEHIKCTQDELDVILSCSILAAQSIIESKHVNSSNMDISNKNSPMIAIDVDVTISINDELEELSNINSEITKKINNSDAKNFIDTISTVSQKVRSVSPDIFDDDISYTVDDINNPTPTLKGNLTQRSNNVTDFMDLTECVNIAPERDKTKNLTTLSLKKSKVILKSNDLMEITECVPTTAKECLVENIDLTHGFNHFKEENYSNNIETENYEMDLTQSSDSDVDLPKQTEKVTLKQVTIEEIDLKINSEFTNEEDNINNDIDKHYIHTETKESLSSNANDTENKGLIQSFNLSKKESHANILETENFEMDLTQSSNSDIDLPEEPVGARQKENSLDETILDNEFVEVIPNQIINKDTLSSPTISEFTNDYDTKIDNYGKKDNNSSDSYLYEYYTKKKSMQTINKENFDITENLPIRPEQYLFKKVDLTQSFNYSKENNLISISKINVTKRKSNDLMEITECVPTSNKHLIENIDLTQSFSHSKRENCTNKLLRGNIQIDLTQSSHSIKLLPLTEIAGKKTKSSLDNSVVIIADSEYNSNSNTNKEALIIQNNSEFANLNDYIRPEDFKPNTIDKNCDNLSLSEDNNEENNAHFSQNCNEVVNSNKENDKNLEMDLTQSSDSNHDPIVKIDAREREHSLDNTVLITEDNESNLDPVIPKDSICTNDNFNEFREKNNQDNNDENISDQNFNSDDVYNSFVFDHDNFYDHDNNLPENTLQDNIVIEDFGIDSKRPSYTKPDTHLLNNSDKINEDKSDIEELDNIDLTQNSQSSNEVIENQYNPTYDTNIGKIDNVSIDYDEMFNDIVSTRSEYASNSLKSTNTSNDSIRNADSSSNNEVSNPSQKSDCFEISDKEFNYSLHQSRHNFDIGGLSVLDNVSDFKMHSINSRHSKTKLNRSLSENELSSASAKKLTVHTPKPSDFIHESSTPLINKRLIQEVQNTPRNSEYIIKTNNVTPMQDYESMTSPERNRELEKYGLKPFKRKRAIQLLKHLYEQTHPVVESCDIEECSSPSKRRKYDTGSHHSNSPGKSIRSPRKSPKKCQRSPRKQEFNLVEDDKENTLYAETKDTPDIKEVNCVPEDWVFQKREKAKIHSCKVPLHIAFHNYVSCRRLLREAILRYEPINIDVIHKDLVACGYKYNPKDLLRFLDKKCITVKTTDNNTRNKKS